MMRATQHNGNKYKKLFLDVCFESQEALTLELAKPNF
jgi:hypothetical protein